MSISADLSKVIGSEVCGNGVPRDEMLPAIDDDYGGVIVEMKEYMDTATFVTMLRASMLQWRQQGKRGVWIKLPIGLVHLVETAVKEGFRYHHAEPSYLMLVSWIPETPNTIPENASHRVGVGAIILNDKREVLVVQEKSGRFRGTGIWKIPTGVVDEGEDIFTAAIREVKEETGVNVEFVEVLGFRQSLKTFFEKSDLFFLCMMRPLSFDIQKQELEIEAAQWMPFEEYAAQPVAQKLELFKYINELCLAKVDRDYAGFYPRPTISMFNDQPSYLYLNTRDLDKSRTNKDRSCICSSVHARKMNWEDHLSRAQFSHSFATTSSIISFLYEVPSGHLNAINNPCFPSLLPLPLLYEKNLSVCDTNSWMTSPIYIIDL